MKNNNKVMKKIVQRIHKKYGVHMTIGLMKKICNDREFIDCQTKIVYGQGGAMSKKNIAFANYNRKEKEYTIYLRPFLKNCLEHDVCIIIAHEIGHIISGRHVDEYSANIFASYLLNINIDNVEEILDKCRNCYKRE